MKGIITIIIIIIIIVVGFLMLRNTPVNDADTTVATETAVETEEATGVEDTVVDDESVEVAE